MVRNILAILGGVVFGVVTIQIIQYASQSIYPPPEDLDMRDFEALSAYVQTMPVGAFLLVLLSHILGALSAAYVTMRIARNGQTALIWIVGAIILFFTLVLHLQIKHPLWFTVLDIASILPAAWLGGRLAKSPRPDAT